jgi:CheY-like chemotaxis protein
MALFRRGHYSMNVSNAHFVAASSPTCAGRAAVAARRRIVGFGDTGIGGEPDAPRRASAPIGQEDSGGRPTGGPDPAIACAGVAVVGDPPMATSPGRDSRTTVFRERPTSPPAQGGVPPGRLQEARGPKILLVEDYQDIARYLTLVLRQHGYEVSVATSLAEARAAAVRERFHLLISDIDLPDGTGLELMRELGGGSTLPGLALSGFGSTEDVEITREAGFAAHLTKPVEIWRLVAMISQLLASSAATAGVSTSKPGRTGLQAAGEHTFH